MMISGQKAAHLALQALGRPNAVDGTIKVVSPALRQEFVIAAKDDEVVDAWALRGPLWVFILWT